MANNAPEEKSLRFAPFIIQATRGVVRDQTVRRKTMFALLILALLLLFSGSTFLAPVLNPREHLVTALIFWAACVWVTVTALLLALFDLLRVRRVGRREQLELRRKYSEEVQKGIEPLDEQSDSRNHHDG